MQKERQVQSVDFKIYNTKDKYIAYTTYFIFYIIIAI